MKQRELADNLLDSIEQLILFSEENNRPLEMDPQRGQLFEMFVTAQGAGYLEENSPVDFTADELCKALSNRWNLSEKLRNSMTQENSINSVMGMARMRLLWSVMRMWMEWDYAWKRWDEFHIQKEQ
jgi:hypothetical protein